MIAPPKIGAKFKMIPLQGRDGVAEIRDGDDPGGRGGHAVRGRAGALLQHDDDPEIAPLGVQPRSAAEEVARPGQEDAGLPASW